MHSKLLLSQFPSEIDSYKPPTQYLYFHPINSELALPVQYFLCSASVNFSPCLQEINL